MKKLPPESRIRTYACCYGAVYFATVSMKTLYSTFLVSVALQGYQLPLEWFYFGQAVLGAWNAVDDSIAAVFASWLHRGDTDALRHINAYLFGAPWLVTAFLIPFFPWSTTDPTMQGLHYVFSICFWDAAMSYVGVSHSALGTDISGHLVVRTRCKKMEIVALTVTSFVIGIATTVYDAKDLSAFRRYVVGMSLLSAVLMLVGHRILKRELTAEAAEMRADAKAMSALENESKAHDGEEQNASTAKSGVVRRKKGDASQAQEPTTTSDGLNGLRLRTTDDSVQTKVMQTARNRNFRCWIVMQFCVYCNTVFQTKFYHLFSQSLFLGSRLDGLQGPILSTAHVVRSMLSVFFVLPAVERRGIFTIFRIGILVQLVVASIGGLIAYNVHALLPYVFMLNVIACSHKVIVGMFIADLTDEDLVVNLRPQSQSSFFFSIRSLFTVWGDSAVPMVVVWSMTRLGIDLSKSMSEMSVEKQGILIAFWWGVPLGFALIKLFVSSYFTLKGEYLQEIRTKRQALVQRALADKVT